MAWTTPRNWTTGELVSSTIMNTHVRDNLNILHPPYAYSLPTSPSDEQQAVVTLISSPYAAWHFRYSSPISDAYKWQFIGGGPLVSESEAAVSGFSTTYTTGATTLELAIPFAGFYIISTGFNCTASGGGPDYMSYDIGGTAASDNDAVVANAGAGGMSAMRSKVKLISSAVTLTVKHRRTSGGAGSTYDRRWIQALPIRVGD